MQMFMFITTINSKPRIIFLFLRVYFYKKLPRQVQSQYITQSNMWKIRRQTSLQLHLFDQIDKQQLKSYIQQCLHRFSSIRCLMIFNDKGFWAGDKTENHNTHSIVGSICELDIHGFNGFSLDLGRIQFHLFQQLTNSLSVQYKFITSLLLYNTCLGDLSIPCIVEADWPFITEFSFQNNNITSVGVKILRKCNWKYLTNLSLSENPIKNTGIKELIKNNWRSLKALYLADNKLTDDGLRILAKASWSKLETIHFQDNFFTQQSVNNILIVNWRKEVKIRLVPEIFIQDLEGSCSNIKINKLQQLQNRLQSIRQSYKLDKILPI